jgi:phosphatidylserine/phosphatidylglycerophosphate/cardiolipin synthase-like enzyme
MLKERNFVVHDEDPQDVSTLVALFDADWSRQTPDLSCTRLLISPVNSKPRLLALINGATRTLVIESMQFADSDVRSAVVARKAAGVDVRVLLADPSWITANTAAATFLAGSQIPVRWLGSPNVHVKAMVVDGATAYAGSENLSWTSLTKNREVGVITTEAVPVKAIADTFEQDWAAATSF